MMGVADGHGQQGHLVSNFVKINLPKILTGMIQDQESNIENTMKKNTFLPQIGKKSRNPYEIEGPVSNETT